MTSIDPRHIPTGSFVSRVTATIKLSRGPAPKPEPIYKNVASEITIMRSAGMSIHRVLFPIGFVCGLVAIAHFLFHETVVIGASEKLAYWEANNYAVDLPPDTGTRQRC